jgi:DNA polymerase I-like protein with 3'-5' exonuclease and polymerase domains
MAGLSVPAVKRVQDFYFSKCPEIPQWWARIDRDLKTKGYTTNIFGARFWCADLKDPMYMNKMVASPIQGAAGILVNKALCLLEENEKHRLNGIQARLQVHDSIAGLIHITDTTAIQRIKSYMEIAIPYKDDPLIIQAAVKTSAVSYGQCY